MTPRLSPEDQAWLERELGEAAIPITPRPDYVARTKQDVLAGRIEDQESSTLAAAFVVAALAAGLAGALLVALTWLLGRRR